jgi:hypothetical protein
MEEEDIRDPGSVPPTVTSTSGEGEERQDPVTETDRDRKLYNSKYFCLKIFLFSCRFSFLSNFSYAMIILMRDRDECRDGASD